MSPELIRVSDRIYCVRRNSYLTCSYVILTGGGAVLVDAGMRSDGSDMLFALERLGRRPSEIQAILLTHWHGDHSAGVQLMQGVSNAPVYHHELERPYFDGSKKARGLGAAVGALLPEWGALVLFKGILGMTSPLPVLGGISAAQGQVVLGEFEAIETSGHTQGHLAWFWRPERALFSGDAIAVVDRRIRPLARPVTPDLVGARVSMLKLLDIDFAHLCPGHREPLSGELSSARDELRSRIEAGKRWPMLG